MRAAGITSLLVVLAVACGGRASETPPRPVVRADSGSAGQIGDIPPGFGTLRQDDVAIRVTLPAVLVRLTPLDESVIRVLSPDSYRALHELVESKREIIAERARRHALRQPSLWYVSYYGVQPEARFSPHEIVITSAGRDYRPLEVIPLSPGFGTQTLGQREVQSAIYIFDESVVVDQPLRVNVEGVESAAWERTLRVIERERALAKSRAGRSGK